MLRIIRKLPVAWKALCSFLFLRQDRPAAQIAVGVVLGFIGIALSARPWEGSDDMALAGACACWP